MKKILCFAFAISMTIFVGAQNMSNLHQVLTTSKTKNVAISNDGHVFYSINESFDKRVVVYDPIVESSVTVDSSWEAYTIENTPYGVFVGSDIKATKYDQSGNIQGWMSCSMLGLATYNAGINSITYDPSTTNMYFGSINEVVCTNQSFGIVASITPIGLTSGNTRAEGLAFKDDTLFMALKRTPATSSASCIYIVGNLSTPYGMITSNTGQTCTDIQLDGNDIYFTKSGDVISRNGNFIGGINFDGGQTHDYLCAHKDINMWFGTADGSLFELGSYVSSNIYNSNKIDMKSMFNVDSIYDIKTDLSGEIWIATDKGLYTTANVNSTSTGVDEISKNISILYPNPNEGLFSISIVEKSNLMVYDAFGKNVYTCELYEGNNNITLNVSTGLYYANVTGPKGIETLKFIVK